MDPLTASVALSITQLCISTVMAGLYFAAPAERYMRYWAMSGLLTAVGISVLLATALRPSDVLLAAGNISLFAGCVAVWMGLRSFFEQDAARRGYLLTALFALLFSLLLLSDAGFTKRAYLSSSSLILVFVLCLKTIHGSAARISQKRSFARALATTGLLLLIGAHAVRVLMMLRDPGTFRPGSVTHSGTVILYLLPLAGSLLFFSALPLLYFERIRNALVHSLAAKQDALETQLRFVAMFSHEYRTPLAIIRTNLDILQSKDQLNGNPLASNLAKMRRAVMRLVEVTETALTPERIDDGRLDIRREAITFPDFLATVTEEAAVFWSEHVPQLLLAETQQTVFYGDIRLLKTAVLNLLDNAIKFAPKKSTVVIVQATTDHALTLTISDNGPGIPEHELSQVFGKYFRGSRSVYTHGSGVGLYLVQRIVAQHGGSINLKNRPCGGIVATLTLPFPNSEARSGRVKHQGHSGRG